MWHFCSDVEAIYFMLNSFMAEAIIMELRKIVLKFLYQWAGFYNDIIRFTTIRFAAE